MSRIVLAFLCLVLAAGEPASAALFEAAGDYNLFTIGSAVVANSDAEGSAAIGGDATLASYSVASHRSDSDARLVVDGHLSYANGQVGISGTGTIYAASASLAGTNPTTCVATGSGLDFNAAADYLTTASTTWGALSATGTAINSYGTITLTGTNSDLNVFSLGGADLLNANALNINASAGSTVLINVSGATSGMTNMGFSLTDIVNSNILFNFYEATDLTFQSVGIQGSVLAPSAAVDFKWGNIDGQMMAYSLGAEGSPSTGEFHDVRFTGQITPAPLPGAVWLLGTGIIGFAGLRRKLRA